MSKGRGSFHEIDHTADLAIHACAKSLPQLFATAGESLYSLIAESENIQARDAISVSAQGAGSEEVLHAWLCELLALFNLQGFVGKSCVVEELAHDHVRGIVYGEKLDLSRHRFRTEIKGVTYHDFKVWEEDGTWHARIVFDV